MAAGVQPVDAPPAGVAHRRLAALAVVALAVASLPALTSPDARSAPAGRDAQAGGAGWTVDLDVTIEDGELLHVAAAEDGGAWLSVAPHLPQSDFATVRRIAADGSEIGRLVTRDEAGLFLQPLAVAPSSEGGVYVAGHNHLMDLEPDGSARWHAAAGDGHPDFGPAARALAGPGPDGLLYGVDLANARVVGYDAGTGARRKRLGAAGESPGSYLAPRDIALGPDGDLWVADFGNQRIQRSDSVGNPVSRWPLPARPVALAVSADGGVFVALDDDRVLDLAPDGAQRAAFGGHGRDIGQLRDVAALSLAPDGRLWIADRGNARVLRLRPPGAPTPTPGGPTPTAVPPSPTFSVRDGPFPTALPTPSYRLACPGKPITLPWSVTLPAKPARADVLLAFDTTGSMEGVVSVARDRAAALTDALSQNLASGDAAYGVLSMRDMPYGEAGAPTDLPWRLLGPLRPAGDLEAHVTALSELRAGGGGDAPEAYAGALAAALADPRIGWRADARKLLVLLMDSVPRDDDLNEDVLNSAVPGVWTPGRPRWWRDSGPDWAPASRDDLDWQTFLRRLAAEEITLLTAVSGAAPSELAGSRADLSRYWGHWTGRTPGGMAVELDDVAALPDRVGALVAAAGGVARQVRPGVRPAQRAPWVTFTPELFGDVVIPDEGRELEVEAMIAPPADTVDATYALTLTIHADGGLVAQRPLWVGWSRACPGSATPTPNPSVEPTPRARTPMPGASSTPSATPPLSGTRAASATPTRTPSPPSPTPPATPTTVPSRMTSTPPTPARAFLPVAYRRYCAPRTRPRADVVLALDTSSSMAGAKLAAAREGALALLDLLATPRDMAAIVTFDDEARLRQWLTGERALLDLALLGLRNAPGTRIDRALDAALEELQGPRGRAIGGATGSAGAHEEARAALILLTDGRPDVGREDDARAAARRARDAGVALFTIGLGADAPRALLTELAGDPERYRDAAGPADLRAIYADIAGELRCE